MFAERRHKWNRILLLLIWQNPLLERQYDNAECLTHSHHSRGLNYASYCPLCKSITFHMPLYVSLCRVIVIVTVHFHEDIDECATTQAGNCDHRCGNTLGSYQCYCNEGYTLEENECQRKY